MKRLIPILFLLALISVLSGCDNNGLEFYTVTFDSDGGTYTPSSQLIKKGNTVVEPKSPDKSGTKGFMWWTKDGSCYDFSSPVTSNMTLKALYWPAECSAEETSNGDVKNLKNEVRYIHNIVRVLITNNALMTGETDVKEIFSIKDDGTSDSVKYLFANMRMDDGYLMIKGERCDLDKVSVTIHLDDENLTKIKKNTTKQEAEPSYESKYSVDIEGLSFKLDCVASPDDGTISETLSSSLSIKGIVIKHNEERYEFHLQLLIENDGNRVVYPVIHAGAIKSGNNGDDNILFYNYKGYTGYIPNVTLW